MTTQWEITTSDWLTFSAGGIVFGLIFAWFWIVGRIADHPEYWQKHHPKWFMIAGEPKQNPIVPRKYAAIPPKIISVVGLATSIVFYHVYNVIPAAEHGLMGILWAETSFVLFLLLTWIGLVSIAEHALEKLPSRQTNGRGDSLA